MIQLINADSRRIPLADRSVHCVVTSPPYYGLRDYGVEGQIGLEQTPSEFIAALVTVFRDVWRVLRDDGTVWLNLGDSYAGSGKGGQSPDKRSKNWQPTYSKKGFVPETLKPKDIIGVPWRVAFALQADGWYLRQDIIWHKPNPMPESVTDRCTKAHEYIFLLSKNARYYYDHEAIMEKAAYDGRHDEMFKGAIKFYDGVMPNGQPQSFAQNGHERWKKDENGIRVRNKRSVWTVITKPYHGAHFAAFPPDLIRPCILAGCPEGGTVLDPFVGTGTTLQVARANGRSGIGLDLSMTYLRECAMERLQLRQLREWGNGTSADANWEDLPMFRGVA